MKYIIVKWVRHEMRVIASDHPRYVVGGRFDFGLFTIATHEGYTIIALPSEESE